ncbi:CCAAT/enhancer-binding protein zeta [Sesbania bispinosa]|nr:CCAAT/enhancer-binding protein zeta [Sesbania bispinosa]
MARTLLSGANIVYNGNPLHDLSLTAFLDKFMEKKPKQSTWHGGSQIEPAKQMDVNNHLIGYEEFEHLMEDGDHTEKTPSQKKHKSKKRKK